MFRDGTNVKLEEENFSVGSIMNLMGDMFLVVGNGDNGVALLSLSTFQLEDSLVNVEDCNHLTCDDARASMDHMHVTFSDFSPNAKGLKGFDYEKELGVKY